MNNVLPGTIQFQPQMDTDEHGWGTRIAPIARILTGCSSVFICVHLWLKIRLQPNRSALLVFASLVTLNAGAHDGPGIGIEDPAPALRVGQWFKGTPIPYLATGSVYVVEFWSTWAEPCQESFPLLSKIARKHKEEATVFAVSVFERGGDGANGGSNDPASYVARMGDRMDFPVAGDAPRFAMAQNWMWLADEYELPTVFVIDRECRIAWIGSPTNGLDTIVSNVVAGTFDRKLAHEELHAKRLLRKQEQAELKRVSDLWQEKKYSEALAAIDRLSAAKPEYKTGLISFRYNILLEADEPAAYRYAKELAAGEYRDKPDDLSGMARAICQTPGLKKPDYTLALEIARQACALSKSQNPRHIATLAEVYHRTKEFTRAIQSAEQAIELAKKQNARPLVEEMESRLEQFKQAEKKFKETAAAEKRESGGN